VVSRHPLPKNLRAALLQVALFFAFLMNCFSQAPAAATSNTISDVPWRLVTLVETSTDSTSIEQKKENIPLGVGKVASIGGKSRLEFIGPKGQLLRVGHHSSFSPLSQTSIEFRRGSFLLYMPQDSVPYLIISPGVTIELHGKGTFLGELMPKGGLKLIPLEGRGEIRFQQAGTVENFSIGQIHFFLPEGKRPVNVEVSLPLLLGSCSLLNAFEARLPSAAKLIHQARLQAKKTKTRTGTFVYDAVDEDKIRFLVPSATEPEQVEPAKSSSKLPKLNNPFSNLLKGKKE
jgi:hypothetical protein